MRSFTRACTSRPTTEASSAIHVPVAILQPQDDLAPAEWMAKEIPDAVGISLPTSPDYPPEYSHPRQNLDAARTFIAGLQEQEADFNRVLATVLFTDIVDSTVVATALGDRAWREVLERHHAIVRGALSATEASR